jgi:hypothetical protein
MRARIPGYHPKLARTCHPPSRGCGRVSQSPNRGAAGSQETEDSGLAVTGPKTNQVGTSEHFADAQCRRRTPTLPGWHARTLLYGVDSFPYQRVTISGHPIDPCDVPPIDGPLIDDLVRAVVQVIRGSMSCGKSVTWPGHFRGSLASPSPTAIPVIDSRARRTRRWHRQALLLPAGPNR